MRKSMRMVSVMMAAVMSMSAMSALAAGTSAAEIDWHGPGYVRSTDEMFDKSHDPDAPKVNKTLFEEVVKKQEEVGQYNIKEGKYYVIRKHRTKVNSFGYTRTNYEHRLVKVERVFEDPTWYGSERTVDVRYCDTGETRRLHPGKFFEENYPLFEIDNSIVG